jgi:hypothetical protein
LVVAVIEKERLFGSSSNRKKRGKKKTERHEVERDKTNEEKCDSVCSLSFRVSPESLSLKLGENCENFNGKSMMSESFCSSSFPFKISAPPAGAGSGAAPQRVKLRSAES